MLPLCMTSFSTTAMLEYIAFLSCLEFAVYGMYEHRILKPNQVLSMESLYLKKDLMCVLPTGYGKSLIFRSRCFSNVKTFVEKFERDFYCKG